MTKLTNPIIITKDSSPYLMLSEYSGIYLNEIDENTTRTISIPVNENLLNNFYLVGIQIWSRYPIDSFSSSANFVSISNGLEEIDFYVTPESGGNRGLIESSSNEISFYQRGVATNYPVLYSKQWQSTYMYLNTPMSFNNTAGEIILYPGFVFQNISAFFYEDEFALITSATANIFDDQVGTSTVVCDDRTSGIEVFSNGCDIFTDIIWQTFDKPVV